ncbi:MAG: type I-U CRISPR-associated protein Csx17, partial [Deltaproteobacteria bacterium]|nr:type I-U CRISPR-associated protein Csx17 [Deltaproteobacteria bacterium]
MSMHLMEFGGCRRRSIGAYLKALGLFKALSGWWPRSRALWGGEVFCVYLPAGVTRDEVIDRFMNEWSPEPTFSFWNTDGGWFKKRATPPFQVPSHFTGQGGVERLSELNKRAGELVAHLNELSPNAIDDIKTVKTELITSCAQRFAWLQPWINTAMPLDAEGEPRAAALLGAGGCDGRFDIAKNALTDLIKMLRGDEAIARSALRASLFGGVSHEVLDVNPSLLNPQAGGGFNMGVKGDGAHTSTPWDVALTLSGVTLFQPALSARGDESEQAALSMPFAFTPVPVDSTQTAAEVSTKEQLAPIWERPLTLTEVTALMRDGRLRFAQRNALDAAEAMRGLARLGVERGVVCFDRYLVAERNGLSRYVVYLGSWAPSPNPREGWLRDLDARGWLSQVTLCARKTNLSSKEVPRALQTRCVALLESIGRALR